MQELSSFFKERIAVLFLLHRRKIASSIACFLGLVTLIVFFQGGPSSENYLVAEKAFSEWDSAGNDETYLVMKKALKKVPDLEKKYGPSIAQKLFQKHHLDEALKFAQVPLKNLEKEAPFHADFGETTLLIERGLYQDALQRSVSLKEQMAQRVDLDQKIGSQWKGGAFLFVHNLLRIACLQKELHNGPGEKAAWEELEALLDSKQGLSEAVFGFFKEKGLDLSQYIQERKKHL